MLTLPLRHVSLRSVVEYQFAITVDALLSWLYSPSSLFSHLHATTFRFDQQRCLTLPPSPSSPLLSSSLSSSPLPFFSEPSVRSSPTLSLSSVSHRSDIS